jgi:hypothetical protein
VVEQGVPSSYGFTSANQHCHAVAGRQATSVRERRIFGRADFAEPVRFLKTHDLAQEVHYLFH